MMIHWSGHEVVAIIGVVLQACDRRTSIGGGYWCN